MDNRKRTSRILLLGLLVGMLVYMACGGDRQRTNPLDPERPGEEVGFGLTAVGVKGGIELTWSGLEFPQFERFVIYRRAAGSGEFEQVATATANAHKDSGLVEIVEYEYQVTVIVGGDESRPSKVSKAAPLDGVLPTVALIAPVEGQRISGSFEIVAEGNDNVGVTEVEISIDGEVVVTRREVPYAYSWDVSDLENESSHSIRVMARDAAGNESVVDVHAGIVIDNAKPQMTTLALSDPSPVQAGTVDFELLFDKEMDQTVELAVTVGRENPFDQLAVTGTWSSDTQWGGSVTFSGSTGDGLYTVRVADGKAQSGTVMDPDVSQTFALDTAPPQAGSVVIEGGIGSTNSNEVTLALDATDVGTGVAGMQIANEPSFDGAAWEEFEGEKAWSLASGDGARIVYARFRDGAGNATASVTAEIIVDVLAPTVRFENPADSDELFGQVAVRGIAEDNVGVVRIELLVDGELVSAVDNSAEMDFAWDASGLEDGSTHQLELRALDEAGNPSTSAGIAVTVSQRPPLVNSIVVREDATGQALESGIFGPGGLNFEISFSKDMDQAVDPTVTFGALSPFDQNSVTGTWTTATTWTGSFTVGAETPQALHTLRVSGGLSSIGQPMDADESFQFTLDVEPPGTSSVVVNGGARTTNSNQVTLTLSATDEGSGVVEMQIANEPSFEGVAWVAYEGEQVWSLSAGDGARVVYARFRDAAGNETRSETAEIIVDVLAPTVRFETPGANEEVFGQVAIRALGEDDVGVARIELLVDGELKNSVDNSNEMDFVWDASLLEDGSTHQLELRALDEAGNPSTSTSIAVTISQRLPVVASIAVNGDGEGGEELSIFGPGGLNFEVGFSKEMDQEVNPTVTFGVLSPFDQNSVTGAWRNATTWTGSFTVGAETQEGEHTLHIGGAQSSIGQDLEVDESFQFRIDRTPPATPRVSIEEGRTFTSSVEVSLILEAEDDSPMEVQVSSEPTFTGAVWETFQQDRAWSLEPGEGNKSVFVRFRDIAGNLTQAVSDNITLDTIRPQVQLTNPPDGGSVADEVTISFNGEDPGEGQLAELLLSIDDVSVQVFAAGEHEYLWDVSGLADASEHTVQVTARDAAGNQSLASATVTVDRATPLVTDVTLSNPSPVGIGVLELQIRFSTEMDTETPPLVSVGLESPFNTNTVLGSWEDERIWVGSLVVSSALGDGEYTLSVSGAQSTTDKGMRSDQTRTFVVDTAPPEQLSLAIEGGNAFTNAPGVELTLDAVDRTSGVSEMQVSNDPTFAAASWEPYVETKGWNLSEEDGVKTVYARFRDAAGNETARIQNEVILITNPPEAVSLEEARETTPTSTTLVWGQSNNVFFAGYRIYRSTEPGVTTDDELIETINEITSTVHADLTLEPEKQYFYRVFTFDQSNLATGSNEVEVLTASSRLLSGEVIDVLSGGPISGAEVAIADQELASDSDATGRYEITGFPSGGEFTVRVTATNYLPTTLTVEIPAQGELVQEIELRPQPKVTAPVNTGSFPFSIPQYIALSPQGDRAYVTNFRSEQVTIVNTSNNTAVGSIPVGQAPMGVAPNPVSSQVYVANNFENTVSIVDVINLEEVERIQVGSFPQTVVVSEDGGTLYVVNKGDGTVAFVDLEQRQVVDEVAVGRDPMWAALVPGTNLLFVTNNSTNTVSVVDVESRQVIQSLFVGGGPEGIAASPDGRRVYVANSFDNSVSVIEVESLGVIETLEVGAFPRQIVFAPDGDLGNLAYVTNYSDSNVSIIDVAVDEVLDTQLTVGNFPNGLAVLPDGKKIYVVVDVNSGVTVIEY